MPARITIDENGCVVSIESLPALVTKPTDPKKKSTTTTKSSPRAKTSKGKKTIRASIPARRSSLQRTRPGRDVRAWTRCSVCGVEV